VWGVTLVLGPALLLALERRIGIPESRALRQHVLALVLFGGYSMLNLATGSILAIRGRGTPLPLACPRHLVLVGPYRYVRNPMAVAGIGQGVAIALWFGSLPVLLYAAAGAVVWHIAIRPTEERDLRARFGQEYEVYRGSVPLWWPRWRGYVPPAARAAAGRSDRDHGTH
jgi:protein-S-isoprenylcysteine O-methyltransferase Ste14